MIEAIIFDLGGVYLNRGLWIARAEFAKKFNIPIEDTVTVFIKKHYGDYFSGKITEEEYWKRCLDDLGIKEDFRILRKILLESYKPNKDMPEVLNHLKKQGYRLGLLSDQTREWWPELDKKHGISKHFDFVLISYAVGLTKKDIQLYKLALQKTDVKPENCVYIDDLEENLPPARSLGMKTILYKDTDQLLKELSALGIKV